MTRAFISMIAGLVVLAAGAASAAAQTADPVALETEARLIEGAARIDIVSAMVLPSVNLSAATGSAPGPTITSITTNQARRSTDNTSLRIQGQAGETVSMAIPESFQVVRNGSEGTQALTVRTLMRGGYSLGDGVLLGSTEASQTLSVNVAGMLAPQGVLEPGAYEGVLKLVVQFN